jgi:hypothetical protein
MYKLLNRISSDWFFGPHSRGANLFFSICRSYDFDKGVYYKLLKAEMAIEGDGFFYPNASLIFTISPFKTTAIVQVEDGDLHGDIVSLLIDWDKLKENNEETNEI